jgi:membrane-associated protein
MPEWLQHLLDPVKLTALIAAGGLPILALIVFAETGLLVGFFLPGDSLLFLAGSLCALNPFDASKPAPLSFLPVFAVLVVAAILGNTLNYWLGRWGGTAVWNRPDGRVFKRRYLEQAHAFYARFGGLSLVLTRFIPIARTFTPFIAGVSRMSFAAYTLWNVIGAVIWVASLLFAGFKLGQVPYVKQHIEVIILGIIAVSFLPVVIGVGVSWLRGGKPAAGPAS